MSNSIVFTIRGFLVLIVVFITIRMFLLLFLIIGVVCLGCLVYVWGVRDILNARAIYLQIEEAWA